MQKSLISHVSVIVLLIIITALLVSCGDDKSVEPDPKVWSWQPLGSGLNGAMRALTVYDNQLIAGGNFTTAGGISANGIAAWNGSSWLALGSGVNGHVDALGVYQNKLYAGGDFTTAGGISALRIAAWDDTSWSALGSGLGNWTWAR